MELFFSLRYGLFLGVIIVSLCGVSHSIVNAQSSVPTRSSIPESPGPGLDACKLLPVNGPCQLNIPRYYFNLGTGRCSMFTWGGCKKVNPNNFDNLRECQAFAMRCLRGEGTVGVTTTTARPNPIGGGRFPESPK